MTVSGDHPLPLDFPVPRPVQLDLEVDRSAAGGKFVVRAEERLTGRMEFGGPVTAPIDHTYHPEDADLQAYLKAKAGSLRFVLALMSVYFPWGQPALASASVEIELSDDQGTDQTKAYSLFPTVVSNAKDANRGFTIKPDLTIAGVGGSVGEYDRGTTEHGTVPYLAGGPEFSPHPSWDFRATAAQAIDQPARLGMVVQVPVACTGSMSVTLRAAIDKRSLFSKRRIEIDGASVDAPGTIAF